VYFSLPKFQNVAILTPIKKIKILPLNFTKRCKEKKPHVPKQRAKTETFCKDKGSKELIFLKIEC